MNTNGEIYTVKVLSENSSTAIIAGDFDAVDTIIGINNIAFLNLNDFTVTNPGFITSINGAIYDVAIVRVPGSPVIEDRIYIGGDFTDIGDETRGRGASFDTGSGTITSPSLPTMVRAECGLAFSASVARSTSDSIL